MITTVKMDIGVGCVPQGAVVWILNSVEKETLPTQYEIRMGEGDYGGLKEKSSQREWH